MARRKGGALARAIDALRTELPCRPDELRRHALDLVTDLADASGALWYELGMVDGDAYPVRFATRSADTTPLDLPLARQMTEHIPWPHLDPRFPPKHWNRSFLMLSSVLRETEETFRTTRLYERVWAPAQMEDQLRMVVYHRGEHVAWIGAVRCRDSAPFARAHQRRLAPIADALADALVTARAIERAGEIERGCDLLVTPAGEIVFASIEAESWISRPGVREAVRAWTRAVDRGESEPCFIDGMRPRWSRMHGRGALRYLVHFERARPVIVHPASALSRTQREVGRLAAAGATTAEIASMRDVSTETVRGQLKQIYELLGIGSRAELGGILADLSSENAN